MIYILRSSIYSAPIFPICLHLIVSWILAFGSNWMVSCFNIKVNVCFKDLSSIQCIMKVKAVLVLVCHEQRFYLKFDSLHPQVFGIQGVTFKVECGIH